MNAPAQGPSPTPSPSVRRAEPASDYTPVPNLTPAPGATPAPADSAAPSPTPVFANPTLVPPTGTPAPSGNVSPAPNPNAPAQPWTPPVPQPTVASPGETAQVPRALPASSQELITRLQIFLDQRSFGPGKIDGRWGEFTGKALIRYQVANGQKPTGQIDRAMQEELERIFPIYTTYAVAAEDLTRIDPTLPSKPKDEAHLKALNYRSMAEFLGERFHADPEFIAKLNRGVNLDRLKPGDSVRVPNVQPFQIETMKEVAHLPSNSQFATRVVKVDTHYHMLDVFDGEKLICSFPITPGSKRLPAPIGTWKIVGISTLPWFRWDEAMLQHGERSENYYNLPPGPRNPVGVVWIGLNKRGIGIHGTNSPDTIGRSASHGCIRLANWDAARVISQVTGGMTVQIF
ncbi:MAG: L,D-transpeptidase family protein [Verrucomicrobia bacterium]|nr:L,D-transpeptidase family protein [Verrucomicrobiota bacterium]